MISGNNHILGFYDTVLILFSGDIKYLLWSVYVEAKWEANSRLLLLRSAPQ